MAEEKEQELTLERLVSKDRPSLYILGLAGAHSLQTSQMAVFMVDALGRVRLMPKESVQVLAPPRLSEDELNKLSEDEAIRVKTVEGESEECIIEYLHRRSDSSKER